MARAVRLPPHAKGRVEQARDRKLWSSGLRAGGDVALRAVGFEPAGVVSGSVLSWPFAYRYPPGWRKRPGPLGQSASYGQPLDDPLTARRAGGFVKDYTCEAAASVAPDLGWTWQRVVHEMQRRQLFGAVMDQLREEARLLGAHGVVDIRLTAGHDETLSRQRIPAHELRGTGTAVRVPGAPLRLRPFTTTATASQVHQYLRGGLSPSEALLGVGIVRADQSSQTRRQLRSSQSETVGQFSEGAEQALLIAINDLEEQAAEFGDCVVGCTTTTELEHQAGAGLEIAVEILGTAVRRFEPDQPVDVLPVLRLGGGSTSQDPSGRRRGRAGS